MEIFTKMLEGVGCFSKLTATTPNTSEKSQTLICTSIPPNKCSRLLKLYANQKCVRQHVGLTRDWSTSIKNNVIRKMALEQMENWTQI